MAPISLQSLLYFLIIEGDFFFFLPPAAVATVVALLNFFCGQSCHRGRCGRERRAKDLVDVLVFGIVVAVVVVVVVFDVAIGVCMRPQA